MTSLVNTKIEEEKEVKNILLFTCFNRLLLVEPNSLVKDTSDEVV
jgi:hypothetical protein